METNYFLCANPFLSKVVQPNKVKINGQNYKGFYPSPVLMKLDAKMYHYCHVSLSNLKMMLFSHVSVLLTVVPNEFLVPNSRNAILNNSEEYYI